jgi:dienelactone hydrolase
LGVTLRGTLFDDVKILLAGWVVRWRFRDETPQGHGDPRIRAVIASVPMAAPIDPASLAQPRAAIGLVSAGQDQWLQPRFHVGAVRAACPACEMVAELHHAGHGSLFSPWPQPLAASLSPMLVDPPGFDRAALPAVYGRMVGFFQRHLAPVK